jgi:uncharacterized membrane protein YgaE (UPF0421/DUF939 family)
MTPDDTSFRVLDWIIGAFGALLGLLYKAQTDKLKELQEAQSTIAGEVREIELLVAGSYVKREDFDKSITALFAKLDRIEAKLDNKADK